MRNEVMKNLIEQSQSLLDVAALLPSPFIDKDLLARSVDLRNRMLIEAEREADIQAQREKEVTAQTIWATEVHVRLRTLLGERLAAYHATIEQSGNMLLVRACEWDRWKNDLAEYPSVLVKVEPFRFYTSHNKTRVWHKQDETHEGNFVNLTIAGKKSRLTKPNFRNIAMLIETAVRENQDFITRRLQEKEERLKKASTVTELFGDIIPVIEEKKESTYRPDFGSRRRETQVFHSIETRITPVGVLSGGTIRPHDNGTYSISVNFNALDVETAKRVLAALKAIQ